METVKEVIASMIAGMVGKIVEHPFDTIKVRLQTQSTIDTLAVGSLIPTTATPNSNPLFAGPLDCLRKTLQREGVYGLYQGISCPLVGSMLENAVIFVAYNKIQSLFLPSESQRSLLSPAPLLPLSQLFLCGALSGSLCSFVLTPVELLKCRVQVRSLQVGLYNLNDSTTAVSPRPAARQIFSALWKGGILGMYRGHLWTFMRETGGSGMWFGTYEFVCRVRYLQRTSDTTLADALTDVCSSITSTHLPFDKQRLKSTDLMGAGAFAGLAYTLSMFPVDVIKSVIQSHHDRRIRGLEAIQMIWQKGGLSGFYQGCGVTALRAIPSNAMIFLTYETIMRLLK